MSNGDLLRAAALGEAHLWVGTKGFFPIAGETGEDCSVVQQCLATQLGQARQTLWLHLSRHRHGAAYRLPTGTGPSRVPERVQGTLRGRAQFASLSTPARYQHTLSLRALARHPGGGCLRFHDPCLSLPSASWRTDRHKPIILFLLRFSARTVSLSVASSPAPSCSPSQSSGGDRTNGT